ncbi:MAG: SDR family NAD(P)-dependent oxidoreductase [Halioglobus sp.]
MAGQFENKTVVITGASAGVGAACARAFASRGANLVLVARGQAALNKIDEELSAVTQVLTKVMDVSDDDACANLLDAARATFGSIDILVNNAGAHMRGDVASMQARDTATMVEINLRAPLLLSAMVLPHMLEVGSGAIVMVGSLAGRTPVQGAATYAATKAGLRAFAYSLADELSTSGIHVGVVSPGPIDTGFIMDEIDEVEDIVFSQPMSSAEQVADAILAIAAGEAVEICLPKISGRMTTLSYLFPGMRRRMLPWLNKMGRKNKEKYRNRD